MAARCRLGERACTTNLHFCHAYIERLSRESAQCTRSHLVARHVCQWCGRARVYNSGIFANQLGPAMPTVRMAEHHMYSLSGPGASAPRATGGLCRVQIQARTCEPKKSVDRAHVAARVRPMHVVHTCTAIKTFTSYSCRVRHVGEFNCGATAGRGDSHGSRAACTHVYHVRYIKVVIMQRTILLEG